MSTTITPIVMPKFGLAMAEGKLVGWLVQPGDTVSTGTELAEIETTKITNVYESPASGVLRRQIAAVGDTLEVGALIGVLADADVSDAQIDSFIADFKNEEAATQSASTGADTDEPSFVTVGARRIRVHDTGTAQDGLLPVLLIHGFGGDLTNWMLTQPALAAHTRVVAFDLPGHGESSKDVGDGTPATLAGIVSAIMSELDLPRAHVVGHSLGGAIALELSRQAKDKVVSLNLIAPACVGETINEGFIEGFITADRRKTLEPVLEQLVFDKTLISRKMVEGIIRFKRLDGAVDVLKTIATASFAGGTPKVSLRGVLTDWTGPVQLIWGENDEILPAQGAQGLPGTISVHLLPQTGHMPQLERSAEVNRLLEQAVRETVTA